MLPVALLLGLAATTGQEEPEGGVRLRLDLRLSPVVDQYFGLRRTVADWLLTSPEVEERLAPVRALEQAVGSPLAMGLVEGGLADCQTAADVHAAFASLPETARLRDGTELHLRAPALAVAEALAAEEPAFLAGPWRAHEPELEARRAELAEALDDETLDAISADLARWLGLSSGQLELPVVLVSSAPEPGAFTHRSRTGAVTFVAVGDERLATSLLCEIVVHEAIHALDVSPLGRESLLAQLRRALLGRGVGPTDPLQRDAVHTLFFLAASEAVRRHGDPEHRDYGDVRGYYARAGKAAEVARAPWSAYIAGERSREELVRELVEALAPTERR
jgi:hypothetical protein